MVLNKFSKGLSSQDHETMVNTECHYHEKAPKKSKIYPSKFHLHSLKLYPKRGDKEFKCSDSDRSIVVYRVYGEVSLFLRGYFFFRRTHSYFNYLLLLLKRYIFRSLLRAPVKFPVTGLKSHKNFQYVCN